MMDGVNVVYEAYEARRKRVHDELKSIQMGKADRTQVISVFFILSLLILLSLLRFLFCPPPPNVNILFFLAARSRGLDPYILRHLLHIHTNRVRRSAGCLCLSSHICLVYLSIDLSMCPCEVTYRRENGAAICV